ncbi:phytoene desaturase family protein [Silvibacterium acidisoli]|uniref:phytoene desaturase family protein n=1 Tax=Acidobacteriaceae bacterium ZG23-2 TaxID=2883246 RepID=UPI00406CC53E
MRASVIGSGPNGLSAAIVLAQAGYKVDVYEAETQPGGAARTMPMTLPGFLHDFGSAVHPMAVGSPFFSSLPLEQYGLEWIDSPAPVAHPLDDGTAVMLERDVQSAEEAFGRDGRAWRRLVEPLAKNWPALAEDMLGPMLRFPSHPLLMARFGLPGALSAKLLCDLNFHSPRTSALFAGLAAHSMLDLHAPFTAAVGLMFAATAHSVGWPIPRGGAQALTNALIAYLRTLGGTVHTSRRIASLDELPDGLTLCDVAPSRLAEIAGGRLSSAYRNSLRGFRHGPGSFKVDYALSGPIPWRAKECLRSATVHLGGTFEEIARSEYETVHERIAERPFVLLSQPTLFDSTRAPEGRHIAWAYCHVPNGCTVDVQMALEDQIERFAPGFRDCVLARHVTSPADLERQDANLIGGDVGGGSMGGTQLFLRPTIREYATSSPDIYLCSASTPPGGGVHGMCGYHAATQALKRKH